MTKERSDAPEHITVLLGVRQIEWRLYRTGMAYQFAAVGPSFDSPPTLSRFTSAMHHAIATGALVHLDGKPVTFTDMGPVRVAADGIPTFTLRWTDRRATKGGDRAWSYATVEELRKHLDLPPLGDALAAACERVVNEAGRQVAQAIGGTYVANPKPIEGSWNWDTITSGGVPMPAKAAPKVPTCGECGGTFSHADDCAVILSIAREERRQREAPLVALVAAVPSWAHPEAWRAAVLAARENHGGVFPQRDETAQFTERLSKGVAGVLTYKPTSAMGVAVDAYRRALAPHKAPAPERRARQPFGLACNAYDD